MSAAHCPRQNLLLAALSRADFERVSSRLKLVPLPLGEVLYESGSRQRAVYFPTTAIVSLLYMLADGASAEIAEGREALFVMAVGAALEDAAAAKIGDGRVVGRNRDEQLVSHFTF